MLKIRIETKNKAFENNIEGETVRLLKEVIEKIESGRWDRPICDINGNNVGSFKLTNR